MKLTADLHASLDYQIVSYTSPSWDQDFGTTPPNPFHFAAAAPEGMRVVGGGFDGVGYTPGYSRPSEDGMAWEVGGGGILGRPAP